MKMVANLLTLLAALAVLFGLMLLIYGRENTWALFADPEAVPVTDFADAKRTGHPNDALACPADACGNATVDLVPPVFPVAVETLAATLRALASSELHTTRLSPDDATVDRFVQRTPALRFPDLIDVAYISLGPDRSTVAIHSRSLIGYGDFGTNRARVERWLNKLVARLGQISGGVPAGG